MANSAVHTGFWTDHSRSSSVLGATLTLDANWGSQLVSAAAILVQIIGFSAWTILAFAIHQQRSVSGLRDEYDAQLQVLLRNTQAADSTSWSIFNLGRTWSGRKNHVWRSAAPLSLLPALIYTGFIVAGVFVGQIATNSYDHPNVLLQKGNCGFINVTAAGKSIIGYSNLSINLTSIATQYAQACYSGAGTLSAVSCSTYTVPSLGYTMHLEDEPCPVPDACFPRENQTAQPIRIQTTPIDSHHDLGINAPPGQRLTFQYRATCAPLAYDFVDRFTTNATLQKNETYFGTPLGNATAISYEFGRFVQFNTNLSTRFEYNPIIRFWGLNTIGYTLQSARSLVPHGDLAYSGWQPVAPLNRAEGDLSLLMLTPNSVTYTEPVQDAMFRTPDSPGIPGLAQYIPLRPAYFMAFVCSETYQICNPVNDKCTGWNTTIGIGHIPYWKEILELNDQQVATYLRMASLALTSSITTATNGQSNPLLAQMYLISTTGSLKLPDNQWHLEVRSWFETVLARFQLFQTVFVNIPVNTVRDSNLEFVNAEKQSKALAQQCSQQRVTAPQLYQSYNLFALIFIGVFGVVLPVTAIILRNYHAKLWRINPEGHRYLSFKGEELLQLHRMALEGSGYHGWEGGVKETPRTLSSERRIPQVALVDQEGDQEPILRYPIRPGGINTSQEELNGHTRKRDYEQVSKEDSDSVMQ